MTSSSVPSPNKTSASSIGYYRYSYYAFNHDFTDIGWSTDHYTLSGWIKFDFGSGITKTIASYTVTGSSYQDRSPEDWTFEGSNDDSSWTVLDTRVDQKDWVSSEKRTYSVSSPPPFRYYRLNISDSWQNYALAVGEIELFEGIGTGSCTVVLDANKSIIANFNMNNSGVSISADLTDIPYNTSTILRWLYSGATSCSITPPASIGSYPSGSGSISTGNLTTSRTYIISCEPPAGNPANDSVTVSVQSQEFNLIVIKSGQGTVALDPVGETCAPPLANCWTYSKGDEVNLTATAASGRIFTGWGGDAASCGRSAECNIIMNSAKSVIANFAINPDYYKEF